MGMNISGIDLSKEMITEAKAKDSSIHYQVKDIEQKSSTNIKFDLVFSNLVFHYIEGINIALQNIHHLLKKNGYFIVTIPHPCFYLPENFNWFQDETDTKFFMGNYFSEKTSVRNIANSFRTHHIHRTIGSYIRIFTNNHFKIVELLEPSSKLTKPIGLKKNSQIPFFAIFVIQKCS
jgi:SAM-dependent methyltransferase